ncbi:MAG: hypothetical protein M1821_000741 [Bathelium mastoideum]|nr:MAG: hypothetical protein M1821_000741 [Bathelium mastoideum]
MLESENLSLFPLHPPCPPRSAGTMTRKCRFCGDSGHIYRDCDARVAIEQSFRNNVEQIMKLRRDKRKEERAAKKKKAAEKAAEEEKAEEEKAEVKAEAEAEEEEK